MTPDNPEPAACTGKHGYPSAVIARRVARRAKCGQPSIYRCDFCGRWHFGTAAKRIRRRK